MKTFDAKRINKAHLTQEICAACAKPFAWRKKWARDWAEVHYCSDRCRGNRQAAGA
jgi:hypothetical protein